LLNEITVRAEEHDCEKSKRFTINMPIPDTRAKIDLPVDNALLEPRFNLKIVLGWPPTTGFLNVAKP
jgi:hypothetical protein